MMKKLTNTLKPQNGFTIIELLIATSVLSVILLLVTSVMISIGTLFYKGINESRIQDAVRNTASEVSQKLELSGVVPVHGVDSHDNNVNVYCAGDTRYSYVLNAQMGHAVDGSGGPIYSDVLWRDKVTACDTTVGADLTSASPSSRGSGTDGTELAPPSSRMTAFCIGTIQAAGAYSNCNYSLTSPYTLSVGMAFGDFSQLNLAGIDTGCKGQIGDQFCATASLTTTVASRLPDGV